jgi:DNA-binding IclR family transcriptional regulator
VLDAVDWSPTTTARVIAATALGPVEVARCLHGLEEVGLVRRGPGWWERKAPPRGR